MIPTFDGQSDPRQFLMSFESVIISGGGDETTLAKSLIMVIKVGHCSGHGVRQNGVTVHARDSFSVASDMGKQEGIGQICVSSKGLQKGSREV
jgi:hypothetical protein